MAQVTLYIAGRSYDLACRDGEEQRLLTLGQLVDRRVSEAGRAVGSSNEARQLVMGALLLADELSDLRSGAPAADRGRADAARVIETYAERIEALAERLEAGAGNA